MTLRDRFENPDNQCRDAERLARQIGQQGISFSFTRSSGPGGQNVNKVSTRAVLSFDLVACDALTEIERQMIATRLGKRISRSGVLQIVAARHRTQAANRQDATDRLFALLAGALQRRKPRRPTKIPKSAKVRRLQEKERKGQQKRLRSRHELD